MNIRQVKLALTVDLLNKPNFEDPVRFTLEKMDSYISVTGGYQGAQQATASKINDTMVYKSMSLVFEHFTLFLDLIRDSNKNEDYLQSIDFEQNHF